MTEEKKSKNPFVNMANTAKKTNAQQLKQTKNIGKPSKGFSGPSVVRRSGRGG